MKIDLKGKTILVTGAGRGIGRGISIGLGKSGATVAVHYNQNKEAAELVGSNSKTFQADLENGEECSRFFKDVVDTHGRIDVLINNAGIFLMSPLESEDWESDWNRTINVNLKAAALLSRLAILHFQQKGGGRIINISSRAAFRGDNPEHLAYAASKAGMVALTKSIARGYGKENITGFLIAPGLG